MITKLLNTDFEDHLYHILHFDEQKKTIILTFWDKILTKKNAHKNLCCSS